MSSAKYIICQNGYPIATTLFTSKEIAKQVLINHSKEYSKECNIEHYRIQLEICEFIPQKPELLTLTNENHNEVKSEDIYYEKLIDKLQ